MTLHYKTAEQMIASLLGPYQDIQEGEPSGFAVPRIGGIDHYGPDERNQAIERCLCWDAAQFYVELYPTGVGAYMHPMREAEAALIADRRVVA